MSTLSTGEQSQPAEARPVASPVVLPLSRPLWSPILLAVNVIIWLVMMVISARQAGGLLSVGLDVSSQVLVMFGAKVNALIATGQYWRLFTANFLHVSLFHLLFNSYALWQLGNEVERIYGRWRFLAIYLLSGLYGAVASYALGSYLSAGASGAIFGLVGTLVAYLLFHRELFGKRGRAYLNNMLFIVAVNLFIGVSTPGIDNWGHIGGLVAGFLLGLALAPIYRLPADRWYQEGPVTLVDVGSARRRFLAIGLAVILLIALVAAITAWQRNTATVMVLRAEQAIEANDWEAAEQMLQRIVQQEPDQAEAHFYLGVVQAHQGRISEAARHWERAAALDPTEPNTAWNLALAYRTLGQREKAIEQLQRYLSLVDNGPEAERARELLTQLQQGS